VRDGANARGTVDAEADVSTLSSHRLAGVDTHAHSELDSVRPPLRNKSKLRSRRRSHPIGCASDGHEEGVTLRIDHLAARAMDNRLKKPLVSSEGVRVLVAPELLQ
jgi:hypothetical protein